MPDSADPLTFKLADFERVLNLWDCKLTKPFTPPLAGPGLITHAVIMRAIFAPNGKRMQLAYKPSTIEQFREMYGDGGDHQMVLAALETVRHELNGIKFYGPSAKQTLAMIRMFDALEAAYPQTELLACDVEMPEFMDVFKWGLAAGVAVGLVLDDPEIIED